MSLTNEQRLWVVTQIKDSKERLLSSFDDSKGITKISQKLDWQALYDKCKAADLPFTRSEKHDGGYLRDQVWGRWKRETVAKRDACRRTGTGQCPWFSWEIIVLDILGHDSPIVEGLGIPDSLEAEALAQRGADGDNFGDDTSFPITPSINNSQ